MGNEMFCPTVNGELPVAGIAFRMRCSMIKSRLVYLTAVRDHTSDKI